MSVIHPLNLNPQVNQQNTVVISSDHYSWWSQKQTCRIWFSNYVTLPLNEQMQKQRSVDEELRLLASLQQVQYCIWSPGWTPNKFICNIYWWFSVTPRWPLAPIKIQKGLRISEKNEQIMPFTLGSYTSQTFSNTNQSSICEREWMKLIYIRKTVKDHQGDRCRGLFHLWGPGCEPWRRFRQGSLRAPKNDVP